MTIKRLRDYPTPTELSAMYAKPHDHTVFPDHAERVAATIELGKQFIADTWPDREHISIADLSCGNAAIVEGVRRPGDSVLLGDFAPGYLFTGPLETTIKGMPSVQLFVCCETLEHVADPVAVLRWIAARADGLLLSTPIDAWDDDNPEHVWCYDREGVEDLFARAGWTVGAFREVDMRPMGYPYSWGMWVCS